MVGGAEPAEGTERAGDPASPLSTPQDIRHTTGRLDTPKEVMTAGDFEIWLLTSPRLLQAPG